MASLYIIIPLVLTVILNIPVRDMAKRLSLPAALALILAQVYFAMVPVSSAALQNISLLSFFSLNLFIDPLTRVMLLSIGIVSAAALLVGWSTLADDRKKTDFASLILLSVAGMNGIVLTGDLFSLYVFLEVVAVSSFVLIALHKDEFSLEGAFKYLILSAVATIMMLSAIALILMLTGSLSFVAVGNFLRLYPTPVPDMPSPVLAALALALFTGGLLIKGGLVPFHGWLPDAYSSAPAGVSVFLAGIVTKTTGVYTLIRLVTMVFGFTGPIRDILLFIGALSIVFGALAALGQKDFKRMLAYSSISQVGYIIIALGAGTPLGLAGAVFHLFNHSIFKSQLFINAAAVEEETGTRDMDKLGGLAARMPVTGFTSVVAFLSTAGVPPLGGFWSKLIIIIALWTAGLHVYAVIAVLSSVLTLAYFLSLQRRVFFGKLADGFEKLKEARAGVVVPALVLAIITIGVGILFPLILDTFILPVRSIWG